MIVLVVIVFVSVMLTVHMKHFQMEQLSRKDARLSRIVEAVTHLKMIKLNVWEETFQNSVDELREKELESIKMFLTLQVIKIWCLYLNLTTVCSVSISEQTTNQRA